MHAVERELASLHAEMLRLGGEEAVRLSVLTLVALCLDEAGGELAARTVEYISRSHPSRAIIVLARPDAPDGIEADLSLRCGPAMGGLICTEQVTVMVGGGATLHLSSLVTPLLTPDVPALLWLVMDIGESTTISEDLIAISPHIIVDSNASRDSAATLAHLHDELERLGPAIVLLDLAWASTARWRQLIAQAFDGVDVRPLVREVTGVLVEWCGAAISARTWLVAGWLADRLAAAGSDPTIVVREGRGSGSGEEILAIRLSCASAETQATISALHHRDVLETVIDVEGGVTATRTVPAPVFDPSRLLGTVLEELPDDAIYRRSLAAAVGLAARSGALPPR